MLNGIEPLWKSFKREISPKIFEDKEQCSQFITETSLQLSKRVSFAIDWINLFLLHIHALR